MKIGVKISLIKEKTWIAEMIKIILFLTLFFNIASLSLAQDAPKPKNSVRYVIKPIIGEKVVKADNAIKSLCAFAKIENFSIDEEILNLPGKYFTVSSSNLEVLFLTVQKVYGIEINKTTFEDDSVFYEFKKKLK
jgi:hypothetical protein